MSGNKEAQEDELLALTSIYDEEEFHRAESAQGGEIQLCLELPAEFKVVVKGRPLQFIWVHIIFKNKYVSVLQDKVSIMSASCLRWCSTLSCQKITRLHPHRSSRWAPNGWLQLR